MSNVFDATYGLPSPCCGEELAWEWDEGVLHFEAECECMKRYTLEPLTAQVEHESEEFELDDE